MTLRIDVSGGTEAAASDVLRAAAALGVTGLEGVAVSSVYFLADPPSDDEVDRLCRALLADPVTQRATWGDASAGAPATPAGTSVVEVSPRPGVTDVAARELLRGLVELGLSATVTATATRFELSGLLTRAELDRLTNGALCNDTVEHAVFGTLVPDLGALAVADASVEIVGIRDLDPEGLETLSRQRLLSLDRTEMQVIADFFTDIGRDPTDAELETLAQTWSEHCVHKTFRARIDMEHVSADGSSRTTQVDGILDTYLRAVTEAVNPPWLRSAFVDDAGIVAFDDELDLAFKAETHNHPSALEPFGGANTGVGGVVRDVIGVSARPIAATDVLCFGPIDLPTGSLPAGVLHPRRVADGVVAGIGDYGNKLGLPTVAGAVVYDEGYIGNPLVFCGCVGLLPHGRHPTRAEVGDLVVVLGGRTGRDGIHGATFSSAELAQDTSETSGSAVQIGDPITEKGLIELIERARDSGLYTMITDCGAGGLSSSVGEMGEELGVRVDLAQVPLKYPGLVPWEIWLSEAQERMVVAVPPVRLPELIRLADVWDVEVSVLGEFTGDRRLDVRYDTTQVVDLPMAFLHDGLPRRTMTARWVDQPPGADPVVIDFGRALLDLLAHPSIASKESIIRRYDHEVRGGTLARPLVGPGADGPGDAAVLKPLGTWHHDRAIALGVGINPVLGLADPYSMAVSAVDEAFRNVVAVGADPDRVSLLDNFCWGNPTLPDRLGSLVRAGQGAHDAALAFNAPYISGKDSLYNEFEGRPIPGTLLISALAIVPDLHHITTSALTGVGNFVVLVGETRAELGGSHLNRILGHTGGVAPILPPGLLDRYRRVHRLIASGLVRAAHDVSEGGLAVAAADMAIGGRLGLGLDLTDESLDETAALFAESNGRLLLEVAQADADAVLAALEGEARIIGVVTESPTFDIWFGGDFLLQLDVDQLVTAWKGSGS